VIRIACKQGAAVTLNQRTYGHCCAERLVSQDNDRLTAALAELIVREGVRVGQVKTFSSSCM
jgi:hypothetical protein